MDLKQMMEGKEKKRRVGCRGLRKKKREGRRGPWASERKRKIKEREEAVDRAGGVG